MCSDTGGPASAGSDASLKLGQSQADSFVFFENAQAASALNSRGSPFKGTRDSQRHICGNDPFVLQQRPSVLTPKAPSMFSGDVIVSHGLLYLPDLMTTAQICFVSFSFFLKCHFWSYLIRHLLELYVAVFTPYARRTGRRVGLAQRLSEAHTDRWAVLFLQILTLF